MNPLNFKLDFRSGVPIYVQIVEQVQQLLAAGQLKPGDQLPTVRQLASDIRVNFNTVARAYRMLDEAGLISTQQGRGTYILESVTQKLPDLLREDTLEVFVEKALAKLLGQGYSLEEIQKMVDAKIKEHRSYLQE
ncbi:MAG: GntR family transcriptional regulator [Anaerolineaceae bacterium]|nr:GntR family transcriptional regulator [Anaerolineaceae bacterium]